MLPEENYGMGKILPYLKKIIKLPELIPFLLFFIGVIVLELKNVPVGDDLFFPVVAKKMALLDFLKERYLTWSGRLSVDGVIYFLAKYDFYLWGLINLLLIISLSVFLYRFFLNSDSDIENMEQQVDKKSIYFTRLFMGFFFCFSGVISKGIFNDVIFSKTVSINYLWPVCAGVFALVPFLSYYIGRINLKNPNMIFFLFCEIFACMGQEQVSLMILMFMIFANLLIYFKTHKLHPFIIIQTIVAFVSGLILFIAPGNKLRFFSEIQSKYPDYLQLSLKDHIFTGMQWMMRNLTFKVHLLILFWIVLSVVLFIRVKNKSGLIKFSPIIPAMAVIILLIGRVFKYINFISVIFKVPVHIFNRIFFDFTTFQTNGISSILDWLPYIFWFLTITATAFLILYATSGVSSIVCFFAYLAGFASVVMIFPSPTIFASGDRVLFPFAFSLYAIMIKLLFDNRYGLMKLVLKHAKLSV